MAESEVDVCIIGGGIAGTHLARLLVERALRVAIVERGPVQASVARPPQPEVITVARGHQGVHNARHQALGGNASIWGGGLIRSDATSAHEALGLSAGFAEAGDALGADFAAAERLIGVSADLKRTPFTHRVAGVDSCNVATIGVLPGRARNVAARHIEALAASNRVAIRCDATDLEFQTSGSAVRAVTFKVDSETQRLQARTFVIAAGSVNSVHLALAQRAALGLAGVEVGTAMHDHFSLPMFRFRPDHVGHFRSAIAPVFERGMIVGKHYELSANAGWGARGFLHFQCHFDAVSPYREIKQLLSLRQQRSDWWRLTAAALRVARHAARLSRIGLSKYASGQLWLSPDVSIVGTLDFESAPLRHNTLSLRDDGSLSLEWDVRDEDVDSFIALASQAEALVGDFESRFGVEATALGTWTNRADAEAYLRSSATDAYHFGGGLAAGGVGAPVDADLRLKSRDNVFVLSTAAFARPGVANPTLTLLALAHRLARRLSTSGT